MAGSQERENEIRVQIMGTNGGRCTNHWVFFFFWSECVQLFFQVGWKTIGSF